MSKEVNEERAPRTVGDVKEMQAVLEDEYQYQYFQMVTIID